MCHMNVTVFGNISGKIPATHKIIVIDLSDSCNEKSETSAGITGRL